MKVERRVKKDKVSRCKVCKIVLEEQNYDVCFICEDAKNLAESLGIRKKYFSKTIRHIPTHVLKSVRQAVL